ncbi:hypothetical protein HRG_006824 [Hirsutella rhossiliensis]|uniref:Uncharacterized protein n=1 Tax=Hirsutella rhossiliensis TaxID=111463 RepID=A0A9P8SH36_9HYPO|nr:uncharacterized protein HRG_06824 [Hirsutella rhossiliensis]KAH0961744.1 hypothetical protein HRG_06824 [Hirsutella rhossiliensis]
MRTVESLQTFQVTEGKAAGGKTEPNPAPANSPNPAMSPAQRGRYPRRPPPAVPATPMTKAPKLARVSHRP